MRAPVVTMLLCALACSGRPPSTAAVAEPAASAPIRRLTEAELNRTLRDLFFPVEVPFVRLTDGEGPLFEGDVSRQTPSDLAVEQLRAGAIAVSAVVGELYLDGEEVIERLAPRAFRRPVEASEREVLLAFFDEMTAEYGLAVSRQLLVQAILQSPSFVYRVELSEGPLTSYEMASRLSFFLWGTMPDDELFALAAEDALTRPEEIERAASRMMSDPKLRDGVLSFHRQWLELDRVLAVNKDAQSFPEWNDGLRRAMRSEADRFIEDVLLEGDGALASLLTSTRTRVTAPLAAIYGVAAPAADWDPVELPASERAGLVTQASFLASQAHARQPSPVLRGVFVLERFLCRTPPPPSGDVVTVPPDDADSAVTNRDRYAQHTFDPVCQECHAEIDGIGFGLEGYDAIGKLRAEDNGATVDDSGVVDGAAFQGGPALARLLADSDVVRRCVAEHWLRHARGRAFEEKDAAQNDLVADAFEASGGNVRALLLAIVTSPQFARRP